MDGQTTIVCCSTNSAPLTTRGAPTLSGGPPVPPDVLQVGNLLQRFVKYNLPGCVEGYITARSATTNLDNSTQFPTKRQSISGPLSSNDIDDLTQALTGAFLNLNADLPTTDGIIYDYTRYLEPVANASPQDWVNLYNQLPGIDAVSLTRQVM